MSQPTLLLGGKPVRSAREPGIPTAVWPAGGERGSAAGGNLTVQYLRTGLRAAPESPQAIAVTGW